MGERNYWLGFSVFSGIGPIKFKKLLTNFGSAKDAWGASESDLEKVIGEKLATKFDKFRLEFSIQDYARILVREGVSFLILNDRKYPKLLAEIKNPPFVLYVKGDPSTLRQDGYRTGQYHSARPSPEPTGSGTVTRQARTIIPTIAVVGTRKTTQYGREVTKILTQDLVASGFTIVSGLAIGVDAISHRTAIENNGKTIAVLGCGVDCCYPLANQSIYNSIIDGQGFVISEFPLGLRPTKGSFPARNRIIAGLSLGVLVTEGAEDSGSLITAGYAVKFGRPVFAVPGPITSSLSKGPYKLISRGAKLVTTANDILNELGISSRSRIKNSELRIKKGDTDEENMILKILQNEPLHFDEIVRKTGLQSSELGSILSVMEVKGMVKGLEGGMFSI